jgi:hypothetical protein
MRNKTENKGIGTKKAASKTIPIDLFLLIGAIIPGILQRVYDDIAGKGKTGRMYLWWHINE